MKRIGIHSLKLVYPPITNQEGDWLYKDPNVREALRSSKLYVLAQREELFFTDYSVGEEDHAFRFFLTCGSKRVGPISMPLKQLQITTDFQMEIAPRLLRITKTPLDVKDEPIYWCTPDILLTQWFNEAISLQGLESPWELMRFRMHYVGISKANDSFQRLFETGHKARMAILTNERQISSKARVSDELMLFMFRVEPSALETFVTEADFESMWLESDQFPDQESYAADAEKALVKILESQYNEKKFPNYPKGTDGLYGKGFDRYGFHFEELVEFVTDKGSIRGGKLYGGEEPDLILIEGDEVELISISEAASDSDSIETSDDPVV